MKTVHKNPVLMFNPHQKAKRLQFSIPYKQKKDWQRIKEMPGSFYNRTQRMWTIPNTKKNKKKEQVFFGDRLQIQERSKQAKIPSIEPSGKVQAELERNYQTKVLKGFSKSTTRSNQPDLKPS